MYVILKMTMNIHHGAATFDSQVKQSFTMIVFDTFDELMMHHDVCSLSFFKNTYMDQKEC